MIVYCKYKWDRNKKRLEEELRKREDLETVEWKDLIKMVVQYVLSDEGEDNVNQWDEDRITIIDNGDYHGTLLFTVPTKTYQPEEYDYLMGYIGYGSCSGCDTLLRAKSLSDKHDIVMDIMGLCNDIVCNIVKPFNNGWRNKADFMPVEDESDGKDEEDRFDEQYIRQTYQNGFDVGYAQGLREGEAKILEERKGTDRLRLALAIFRDYMKEGE